MAEEPGIVVDIEVSMSFEQFGDYQLIDSLGIGSFAEVFQAKHLPSGKQVALKRYKTSVKQVEEQFLKEARIAARLQHPHIIRVRDFGIVGDTPYLVMNYAPNGSLDKRHPKGTQLPLPIIVCYVNQIADALQYAHDQRVIHRDIKPANILVGQNGQLLVTDFSIAEIAHSTLSWEEQPIAGTCVYMPPEQFEGKATLASDQYALGIMVYEWLCGEAPFKGSIATLSYQHHNVSPPPLHKKISISPAIEAAVLKALAKRPDQRFSTISDFARALEHAYIEEIIPLLNTPQHTAELLRQEHVRYILLDHLIRYPNWWNTSGRTAINGLRSQAVQESGTNIITLLSTLTKRAMSELEAAIQRGDEVSLVNLLDLIYCTAPPSMEPGVWKMLLENLSANPHAVTFITKRWHIYSELLQQWRSVSPSGESTHLRRWFPKTWPELWRFLALPLPEEWHDIAVTDLLDIASATPLPASIVRSAEQEYASSLQSYLDRPFRSHNQQRIAIRLFTKLVESGYAKKMDLLDIMLISNVGSRDPRNYIEKVLEAAQLTKEEVVMLLEKYNEEIQSYYRLPIVLDYARQYLFAFSPADLDRPSAKRLVQFMSESPSLPLPPELRTQARNWYTIIGFVTRPASNRQELSALADAISRFPSPPLRSDLIDKLVVSFISCVKSDVDLLNVIYAMNTVLAGPELLRFLYRLAQSIGEEYRKNRLEGILVPYIQIALQIEVIVHDVPLDEQQEFVARFLRTLLQHADSKTYRRLGVIARNWHPDLSARWQHYVQRRNSQSTSERTRRWPWDIRD